jgi:hypothetical protein
MSAVDVGLPEALERAASALPGDADSIRPANGDPQQLQRLLDATGAVRVLSWLLQHEEDAGGELARAWVEDSEGGADLLQQIEIDALPKSARKALRRVLHQLRSRGVSVDQAGPIPVVATLPRLDEAIDEAMVTPIDPSGARVACLAMTSPAGGVRLFEVVIDDSRGVIEFEVYNAGRSKVRKFLRDFERRERYAAVPAPPDSVRALVARAMAQQASDRPLPRGFSEWRSRISQPPEDTPTPGEIARDALAVGSADAPELGDRAAALVVSNEVGPWPPPTDAMQALAEKVSNVASGVIVVSDVQRREQVREAIDEALETVYAEPFATRVAERFEESAYLLWKREREDDARACLAAARAFRNGDAASHPVARKTVELVLAPVLERAETAPVTDEGAAPLLVRP